MQDPSKYTETDSERPYSSPTVKVFVIDTQGILCGSLYGGPGNNGYDDGSNSNGGFGGD